MNNTPKEQYIADPHRLKEYPRGSTNEAIRVLTPKDSRRSKVSG